MFGEREEARNVGGKKRRGGKGREGKGRKAGYSWLADVDDDFAVI